ncbi:hypothetical protein [Lysinibacillus sp. KU-BSD001]|uniref:hypothetical protein n=1 Tax=Lysinibacillus sp. KU-BSD001 TaxID=3141328 RepID=UPI0036F393E8
MWYNLRNEYGALFPITIVLLFLLTSACVTYAVTFQMEIKIYNTLELSNVRATIDILNVLIHEL